MLYTYCADDWQSLCQNALNSSFVVRLQFAKDFDRTRIDCGKFGGSGRVMSIQIHFITVSAHDREKLNRNAGMFAQNDVDKCPKNHNAPTMH